MAQAHTTTLLADHKEITRPKVCGDEYVVGLSSITAAVITGHDNANGIQPQVECSATGAYESSTSIALMFTSLDGTNATVSDDGNGGSVRLRVWGNL